MMATNERTNEQEQERECVDERMFIHRHENRFLHTMLLLVFWRERERIPREKRPCSACLLLSGKVTPKVAITNVTTSDK